MAENVTSQHTDEIAITTGHPRLYYGGRKGDALIQSEDPVLKVEARNNLRVYRDLERDPKVYAVLRKRYDMTVATETMILPGLKRGSTRKRDQKMADMLKAHIEAMGVVIETDSAFARAQLPGDFDSLCYGLLDAILMGYAVAEIIWDRDGAEVYPATVKVRPQQFFRFDDDLRLRFMIDRSEAMGKTLPGRKMLAYTYGSFNDPYGLGVGNRLYWPVWFKRQDMTFWLRFVDKYGGPTAMGKYPAGTPKTGENSIQTLLSAAAAVQSESAVAIPDKMDLELLQTITTAAQQGFAQLFDTLDSQIAQAVLGVNLTSEVKGQASRAATQTHATEQKSVGRSDAQGLMNYLTSTLSRWDTDFNMGIEEPAPRFHKAFVDVDMLLAMATMDQMISQASGFRRTLESTNQIYGQGSEAFEKNPNVQKPNPTGGTNGGNQRGDTNESGSAEDEGEEAGS